MLQMKELCALGLPPPSPVSPGGWDAPAAWGASGVFAGEWRDDIHVSAAVFLSLPCVPGAALAGVGCDGQGDVAGLSSEPFGSHCGTLSSVLHAGQAQLGFNISICTWCV